MFAKVLLGTSFKAKSIRDGIIEKIDCCLPSSKRMFRVEGLLGSRIHYPICLRISCLFFLSLLVLPITREVTTRFLMVWDR